MCSDNISVVNGRSVDTVVFFSAFYYFYFYLINLKKMCFIHSIPIFCLILIVTLKCECIFYINQINLSLLNTFFKNSNVLCLTFIGTHQYIPTVTIFVITKKKKHFITVLY